MNFFYERAVQIVKKFPAEPEAKIVYMVYNRDMVEASEILIAQIHGREYLDKYVSVTPWGYIPKNVDEGSTCIIYYDPNLHDYNGNGYN